MLSVLINSSAPALIILSSAFLISVRCVAATYIRPTSIVNNALIALTMVPPEEEALKILEESPRGHLWIVDRQRIRILARGAGLTLDESRTESLVTITAFNIEARYPDVKRSFRK